MQVFNLNIFTILIFIFIMLFLGFCFFTFYKNNLEISKKYWIEFSKYFYFKTVVASNSQGFIGPV